MKKNFAWNMIGSTIYSFISFILTIMITRINGIDDAGVFIFAFSVACILYVVGVYYGRAYQVTDTNYSDDDFINNRIFTCFIMIVLSFVIALLFRLSFFKMLVLVLLTIYKALESFSESIYAIIQKNDKLHLVGKSMVIKSILSVLLFLIADVLTNDMLISILVVLIINVLIIFVYDVRNAEIRKIGKFNSKNNKKLLKYGFNTFAFTLLSVFLVNVSKYGMAMETDKLQGIFGIIIMPATIMSLFSQFIIHPYLNTLSKYIVDKNYDKFKSSVYKMILSLTVVILILILIASVIGLPVLQFIYHVKLGKYYNSFMIIMIGSLFYGLSTLISFILITIRKTFSQLIILIITTIISIIITYILISNHGVFGASLSYAITMLFESILYFIVLAYTFIKIPNQKK